MTHISPLGPAAPWSIGDRLCSSDTSDLFGFHFRLRLERRSATFKIVSA